MPDVGTEPVVIRGDETLAEKLERLGLLRPADVDAICARENAATEGLVAGFIARRGISVLVGDSGIGKSPLAYQLALCVATGKPFLGMTTQAGAVVYADYENGIAESKALRDRMMKFLGVEQALENFFVWSPDLGHAMSLEDICATVKPSLIVLDSIRAHDPTMEHTDYAGHRMKDLRTIASKFSVAILGVHHLRKPKIDAVQPSLESDETVVIEWLNAASGHRAIINQSDTRVAVALPKRREEAMVLKWHRRIHGEGGPIYLERVFDESGEPIGYKPTVGASLLNNPDQEAAFNRLPDEFTFSEAKSAYRRTDDPTNKWLRKCESLGLVEKLDGRRGYRKLLRSSTVTESRAA